MFSKELENLIQATLEDGVLEEYEKAALVKRATAEGVDLTELEIYINSILQKRQRELNEKKNAEFTQAEQQKKEAFGKVCPKCGKQVTPMTLVCECGYEFTAQKEVSSIQKLSEKLNSIKLTPSEEKQIAEQPVGCQEDMRTRMLATKRIELISTFPVPNNKVDIIEFLALAAPKSKLVGGMIGTIKDRLKLSIPAAIVVFVVIGLIFKSGLREHDGAITAFFMSGMAAVGLVVASVKLGEGMLRENKERQTWREKFDQVLMKGRSLRGDAEFSQQLDYYESLLNKK